MFPHVYVAMASNVMGLRANCYRMSEMLILIHDLLNRGIVRVSNTHTHTNNTPTNTYSYSNIYTRPYKHMPSNTFNIYYITCIHIIYILSSFHRPIFCCCCFLNALRMFICLKTVHQLIAICHI